MDTTDFSTVSYITTPVKSDGNVGNNSRRQNCDRGTSNHYKTPVRCNENMIRGKPTKPNPFRSNPIKNMPKYSPPTDVISHVRNPFEHARFLKERLSQPICSPSLFEKKPSPVEESVAVMDEQFTWSIEDISVLNPAPINENPVQEFDSWFSPATENEAQQAINKFFSSQIANMESPVEMRQMKCDNDVSVKQERNTTDSWCQTTMTIPPNLPPEMEAILLQFCNFSEHLESAGDSEDLDCSNCSISRKRLSFDTMEDNEKSLCNTPLHLNNKCNKQTVVSTPITSVLSSPDLSPILMGKVRDSPMDVSGSFKSNTKFNAVSNVNNFNDEGNEQDMSWSAVHYSKVSNVHSSDGICQNFSF